MKLNDRVVKNMKQKVFRDLDMIPHDEVLPRLEVLYTNNPQDAQILKALTHIYYNKKDYAKAFHFVLNALDVSPNDAQALKYKAWIYDETGDKKHYKETLLQIIDAGNADWEVYDQLAEIYESQGDYLVALGLFTNALKDTTNYQSKHSALGAANCYCKSGALGIADEIYDTLLDVFPGDLFVLHNKANNFYLKGELDAAEKILQVIISKDPQFESSKLLLGDIKFKRAGLILLQNTKEDILGKELKSSKHSINKNDEDSILNLYDSPEELDALLHKSRDLQEKGDYEGARNLLETIIKIDDSIIVVWLCLANLHYLLLEIPEAIDCCDKVLSLSKDMGYNRPTGTLKIKAESLFALGKLEEALSITEELMSWDPTNYMPILIKARILNRKGDYSGALNILLPVMSIIPPETEAVGFAHYLLATAYYKLGNDDDYIKALFESARQGCEFGTRWFRIKYVAVEGTLGDLLN